MSWRLARSLSQLDREVRDRWPGTTVWTVGDQDHRQRRSDHNPNDGGVVTAVDVVGREVAQTVAKHLRATRDARIKYVIFDGRIFSHYDHDDGPPYTWRPYSGSNQHRDHVHVSVGRGRTGSTHTPELYDDDSPWGLVNAKEDDVIRKGDEGPEVGYVQFRLNVAGYRDGDGNELAVDEVYGSKTAQAVQKLRDSGLPGSGDVVDTFALDLLRERIEAARDSGNDVAAAIAEHEANAKHYAGPSQDELDRRYARAGHDHDDDYLRRGDSVSLR